MINDARLPAPEVPVVSEKLRYLRRSGDAYNVLFIGSSRVHHQIIPELFDRLMNEAGIRVHSFNLGIDGIRPPEDAFLLEHALQSRHEPLLWVIQEANPIRFREAEQIHDGLRGSYWRDGPRMWLLFQRLLAGKAPRSKNAWQRFGEFLHDSGDFWGHCMLWLPKWIHLSEGVPMLHRICQHVSETIPTKQSGDDFDGYISAGNEAMTEEAEGLYTKDMAALQRNPAVEYYGDPASQQLIQWSRKTVERHGGKLILVVPPTTNDWKFYPDPQFGPPPPVLDFSNVDQFPELYEYGRRKDSGHLNQAGAELFTRLIVRHLLLLIKTKAGPSVTVRRWPGEWPQSPGGDWAWRRKGGLSGEQFSLPLKDKSIRGMGHALFSWPFTDSAAPLNPDFRSECFS